MYVKRPYIYAIETYERDMQKRHTKKTKRDIHAYTYRRPAASAARAYTKEKYKKDQKSPAYMQ